MAWEPPQGSQRFADSTAAGDCPRRLADLDASTSQAAIDKVAAGLAIGARSSGWALRALARAPLDARASRRRRCSQIPCGCCGSRRRAPLLSASSSWRRHDARRAAAEFVESQRYDADRPEGRVNPHVEGNRGDMASAEHDILAAIRLIRSSFPHKSADPPHCGRDSDGLRVLVRRVSAWPRTARSFTMRWAGLGANARTGDALSESSARRFSSRTIHVLRRTT